MKCPHCQNEIEVRIGKAPQSMQQSEDTSDVGTLLDIIEDKRLEGQPLDFVTETRERYAKYGDKIRMSPKQMAWLRKIADAQLGDDNDIPF